MCLPVHNVCVWRWSNGNKLRLPSFPLFYFDFLSSFLPPFFLYNSVAMHTWLVYLACLSCCILSASSTVVVVVSIIFLNCLGHERIHSQFQLHLTSRPVVYSVHVFCQDPFTNDFLLGYKWNVLRPYRRFWPKNTRRRYIWIFDRTIRSVWLLCCSAWKIRKMDSIGRTRWLFFYWEGP